jgi:uncharacterized protein YjbJ (UPF0337 family)
LEAVSRPCERKWAKLTDNNLDTIAGKRDQLAGRIQETYGVTKDQAELQVKVFRGDSYGLSADNLGVHLHAFTSMRPRPHFFGSRSIGNAAKLKRSFPGHTVHAPPPCKRSCRMFRCAGVQTISAAAVTLCHCVPESADNGG